MSLVRFGAHQAFGNRYFSKTVNRFNQIVTPYSHDCYPKILITGEFALVFKECMTKSTNAYDLTVKTMIIDEIHHFRWSWTVGNRMCQITTKQIWKKFSYIV